MRLLINGQCMPVAQMGPDFLLLQNLSAHHPPAQASVVLQVDQVEKTWTIHLPEGISAATKRVTIATNG